MGTVVSRFGPATRPRASLADRRNWCERGGIEPPWVSPLVPKTSDVYQIPHTSPKPHRRRPNRIIRAARRLERRNGGDRTSPGVERLDRASDPSISKVDAARLCARLSRRQSRTRAICQVNSLSIPSTPNCRRLWMGSHTDSPATHTPWREQFALEKRRVFARNWTFVGFSHDAADPGDAYPTHVAGQPILIVRGEGGRLRAFHNVCRHRGHVLLRESLPGAPRRWYAPTTHGPMGRTAHFAAPAFRRLRATPGGLLTRTLRPESPALARSGTTGYSSISTRTLPSSDSHVSAMLPHIRRSGPVPSQSRRQAGPRYRARQLEVSHREFRRTLPCAGRAPDSAGGQLLRDHYMIVDGPLLWMRRGCFGHAKWRAGQTSGHEHPAISASSPTSCSRGTSPTSSAFT